MEPRVYTQRASIVTPSALPSDEPSVQFSDLQILLSDNTCSEAYFRAAVGALVGTVLAVCIAAIIIWYRTTRACPKSTAEPAVEQIAPRVSAVPVQNRASSNRGSSQEFSSNESDIADSEHDLLRCESESPFGTITTPTSSSDLTLQDGTIPSTPSYSTSTQGNHSDDPTETSDLSLLEQGPRTVTPTVREQEEPPPPYDSAEAC